VNEEAHANNEGHPQNDYWSLNHSDSVYDLSIVRCCCHTRISSSIYASKRSAPRDCDGGKHFGHCAFCTTNIERRGSNQLVLREGVWNELTSS
jgi:hypothetical protein